MRYANGWVGRGEVATWLTRDNPCKLGKEKGKGRKILQSISMVTHLKVLATSLSIFKTVEDLSVNH